MKKFRRVFKLFYFNYYAMWKFVAVDCRVVFVLLFFYVHSWRLVYLFIFIREQRTASTVSKEFEGYKGTGERWRCITFAATETVKIFTYIQMCSLVKIYFSTLDYFFFLLLFICCVSFISVPFYSSQHNNRNAVCEWNVVNIQGEIFVSCVGSDTILLFQNTAKLLF